MTRTTTTLIDGTVVQRCLDCPACDDFSERDLKPFRPDVQTVAMMRTWDGDGRCPHCAHRKAHGPSGMKVVVGSTASQRSAWTASSWRKALRRPSPVPIERWLCACGYRNPTYALVCYDCNGLREAHSIKANAQATRKDP